ncbi:GTPase/DUF3482 domain-containing protein [Desulfotalea psychrophila]|uniref:G domain-containing protein n=1 Tax=Desulfotalea psychrophila (strain LSv54 / DSM 12343) TaxID=177439 RepID=Q6AJ98_DESPS|nr:GTPase/DUF3482 domain-containing protein [Desulfotalea psychrophila]CAG37582.1 hypothetical protein DP2853 [Desulfotalea psychrophila LSv54]
MIPEFAIMGHPNEGKSSVLSTLAEDDSVRISSSPGETTLCQSFVINIDDQDILRFTDTPGFQNPNRILYELKQCTGSPAANLKTLVRSLQDIPELKHDIELLKPLLRGAGIIYVVDGSRPIKNVDLSEIEILRLTGRPRMAVINCKDNRQYLEIWKDEFRKTFNSYRVFNAHHAGYRERIHLFEALKSIEQDWQEPLQRALLAFKQNWQDRTQRAAELISTMLGESLSFSLEGKIGGNEGEDVARRHLFDRYKKQLEQMEKTAQSRLRDLYKHNIYNYTLPPNPLLSDNLFTAKNWQLLGLSKKQCMLLGGLSGAGLGAGIDLAFAGLTFGIFTAAASAGGAVAALFTGQKAIEKSSTIKGIRIANETISIGPAKDIRLLFILLNRSFLFYQQIVNWAHGRRDSLSSESNLPELAKHNFTQEWSRAELTLCKKFFNCTTKQKIDQGEAAQQAFNELLLTMLEKLQK